MLYKQKKNINLYHYQAIKTKEHNNRKYVNTCIRNLDTNKERQKANEHFLKESV